MLVDRYPSIDEDGSFIYLEAPAGKKLLVAKFDVINQTSEPVYVDLLSLDVDYRIVLNNSKAAKPLLTILMDDLSTYQGTIAPSSTQDAVLVFQIADSLTDSIENLDLKITYNYEENTIVVN